MSCVLLLYNYNYHIILGCRITNFSPKVCLNSSVVCVLIPSKGKKTARKLSDVEEEEESEIPDMEEEGEKENEDLCNEGSTPVSKPKKKCKRKNRQDASAEEPNDKKNKTDERGKVAFCYFKKILFFHKVFQRSPRVCGPS